MGFLWKIREVISLAADSIYRDLITKKCKTGGIKPNSVEIIAIY